MNEIESISYIVGNRQYKIGDFVNPIGVACLQWTATPPTVEGWYWVSIQHPYHGRHETIIYVDKEQTYLAPTDWDSEHREHINELGGQNNGVMWLGPLPKPDAPK